MKWCTLGSIFILIALLSACSLPVPSLTGASATSAVSSPAETQAATLTSTSDLPADTPTASETLEPAALLAANATATATPTQKPSPTPTVTPMPRFAVQPGTPLGIANFVQPEAGCEWMGVGGQALDISGSPVSSLVVEVGGTLEGKSVFHLALSGSNPILGPGGFVIQLATQPVASEAELWVQIKNLAGKAESERVVFSTYADCEHNFILVNFSELTASISPKVYLPAILRNTPQPP